MTLSQRRIAAAALRKRSRKGTSNQNSSNQDSSILSKQLTHQTTAQLKPTLAVAEFATGPGGPGVFSTLSSAGAAPLPGNEGQVPQRKSGQL